MTQIAALMALLLLTYLGWVWWTLETLADPKSCFTTRWNQVKVCPDKATYLRFSQIPDLTWRTLVLAEDGSFFQHPGYDLFELRESFKRNWEARGYVRGGSTITQQLAKNLYLTPEKSIRRKFKELLIAKRLEKSLSKQEILEKYLNVIEFGEGVFGLRVASRFYFSKQPRELNLLETVYLISLIPNPKKFSSGFPARRLTGQNKWRMKTLLQRLLAVKRISPEDHEWASELLQTSDWPFEQFQNPQPAPEESWVETPGEISLPQDSQIPSSDSSSDQEETEANELDEETSSPARIQSEPEAALEPEDSESL